MWGVGVTALLGAVVLVWGFMRLSRSLGRSRRLPPGTMGWPFVGETMQLFSQHPNLFFHSKQKRFGEIVKTHIIGCPAVMMASVEAAKLVLLTQAQLFKPTYPASKQMLIGKHAIFFQHGPTHQNIRHLVQSSFAPDVLRENIGKIEGLALGLLNSLEGRDISTFAEMKKLTFDVGFTLCCGSYEGIDKKELKETYHILESGYNALPINFPGSGFGKALKARKHLTEMVGKIISDRMAKGVVSQDLLGTLMKKNLPLDQISDNIIGVIFAAQDTTASVLTWLVKYLSMNPAVLGCVTAEQEAVRASKVSDLEPLTWADTKDSMTLTSRVIQETLRLASVLSFTFREATEDVEYKGYLIPKGWKVMPLFRNIHHNPEYYPDPFKFDTSRFEKPLKPNTYMPFGLGAHACVGSELARLEILMVVHHLVTKFRWELLEPKTGIDYRPFPVPKAGLPMRVTRKQK